jgi:hypothetical protein
LETQKAGGCVDLWWFMMIYDDLSILNLWFKWWISRSWFNIYDLWWFKYLRLWVQQHREYRVWQKIKKKQSKQKKQTRKPKPRKKQETKNCGKCRFW